MPEMMTWEAEVHFQASVYLGNRCKVGVLKTYLEHSMHYITLSVSHYKFETSFMRHSDRVINDIKHQSMSSIHNYTLLTLCGKNVYTTQIQMELFNPYSVSLI
jgi:hypothetical protein